MRRNTVSAWSIGNKTCREKSEKRIRMAWNGGGREKWRTGLTLWEIVDCAAQVKNME